MAHRPVGLGVGIGLALVRRLVELHGGHITIESQFGQGSCFKVNIPLKSNSK
ncbi:ATP-binding protein [Leptolyngbya sp. 'hensonii']|uniref:ATP-binding protein n=1 Tax=Leptolyngbya sp. 'hensonii' TaxID=1922337 RepID=UPI0009F951AC|nr:ATP-binding protein [Leptolyngbya sp. 'hensonii']